MDMCGRGVMTHGHFLRPVSLSVYFLSFVLFFLLNIC
jgi:hypothetical protein